MGAAGSVVGIVFGLFWTLFTIVLTKDAPFPINVIFPLFGILFVVMGIIQAVYHYKNATGKHRMSIVDIVEGHEEPDPLDRMRRQGYQTTASPSFTEAGRNSMSDVEGLSTTRRYEGDFCPFCGKKVERKFDYCPYCGKDI